MNDKIFMYEEKYANNNHCKAWTIMQIKIRFALLIFSIIFLMFPLFFLGIYFLKNIYLVILLFFYFIFAASLIFIQLVTVHSDIQQTAFIVREERLWEVKLGYLNQRTFLDKRRIEENIKNDKRLKDIQKLEASYFYVLNSALNMRDNHFVRMGKQIIIALGNEKIGEVIRLDGLKIEKETEKYSVISYLDFLGKRRKQKILRAYPDLDNCFLIHQTDAVPKESFPICYKTNYVISYAVQGMILMVTIFIGFMYFWNIMDPTRLVEIENANYLDYITADMYKEAVGGDDNNFTNEKVTAEIAKDGECILHIWGSTNVETTLGEPGEEIQINFTNIDDKMEIYKRLESDCNWGVYYYDNRIACDIFDIQ